MNTKYIYVRNKILFFSDITTVSKILMPNLVGGDGPVGGAGRGAIGQVLHPPHPQADHQREGQGGD